MLNMHFIISVYGMMATKTHNSTSKVHIIIPPPPKRQSYSIRLRFYAQYYDGSWKW